MKNKIIVTLTLLAGLFLLNSCLKDDADYWKDDVSGKMYATVLTPQLQVLALDPVAGDVPFSFMINIATDALPTKDITVTLKVDADAVATYNAYAGKSYKVFPFVEILNPTVVILKGTRTAIINCKVWGAETLDPCDNFIAGVTIESVSGGIPIAGNMKSYIVSLPIANPFQGTYQANGTFTHPVNGPRTIDEVKELITVNCKAVKTSIGDLGVGSGDAIFTVNADNTVTVTGGLSASQPLVQSGINVYDPATETFTVNYYYVGAGGNRVISEVLKKKN